MGVQSRLLVDGDREMSAKEWAGERWLARSPRDQIATRIIGGRMETVTSAIAANTTFEMLIETAAPFDAVRVIMAQGYDAAATSLTGLIVGAAAVPSTDQTEIGAASWVQDPTGAACTPAASLDRRKFTKSSWLRVSSIPRTDGGTGYLAALRVYGFSGATIVTLGAAAGADSFTNWATRPSRMFRMRQQTTNGVTTPTNFTSTTNRNTSPIVGIEYLARGQVFSLVGFGDSNTDARGTYLMEGFGTLGCEQLSTALGVPVEWSNLGWAGINILRISDHAVDAVADGLRWSGAVMPVMTPNSLSQPIVASDIFTNRVYRARAVAALADVGIPILGWTVPPSNPPARDYNASDSLRRAHNDEWRALAQKGEIVLDFDSIIAGVTDGDGQVLMKVGTTDDNIHFNDAANAMLASIFSRGWQRLLYPAVGKVVV